MYAWQFAKMLSEAAAHRWTPFVSMQNHYNLIYREEEREMIPQCLDQGVGILPWSPLARGWLAGLRDRYVGRALGLLHERPAHDWTIDELGRDVGLSRSALHERFVQYVGQPPMQYLANWRVQVGSRLLRETHRTVAAIAQEVGYESEAAFSRAFKRLVGSPPATWRRSQAPKQRRAS